MAAARVQLQAQQLARAHGGAAAEVEQARLPKGVDGGQHFAFQALEVFERDVEEVAGAAGGVEDAQRGEAGEEAHQLLAGVAGLAFVEAAGAGGLGGGPLAAQGLEHGGQHQALDVAARGVVGTQAVALLGVEGALEQGAEDGGLHLGPVGLGRLQQQGGLVGV